MIRLTRIDPDYPERLRKIRKPPEPLWLWGTLPSPGTKTVGIVGTRRLTPVGSRVARLLAMSMARAGAVVVSGLAQGIDSVAHGGALDAGGRTIAVLGEGLAYFDEHGPLRRQQLARRIRGAGALLSEYALDISGRDWTFPKRNRTIAALSDALIVVEAPVGSGALITAEDARNLGRPVFVVPGPMDAPTWQGSNRVIAKGEGTILTSVEEVATSLGLTVAPVASEVSIGGRARLAEVLGGGPADTDQVASALEIRTTEAAMLIAEELIAGRIIATGDGRFALR